MISLIRSSSESALVIFFTEGYPAPEKVAMAQALYREPYSRVEDLCQVLNISRATLYRYVKVKPTAGVEGQGDASEIGL